MRVLLLFVMLLLALSRASAQQDPAPDPPPDPALLQRFVDATPEARRQLVVDHPVILTRANRTALSQASLTHATQGRRAEAVRGYEALLDLVDLAGSRIGRISALISLASVYGRTGDYGEATRLLNESLALADPEADKELVASAANNLGNIYRRRGEHHRAFEAYTRALASQEAVKQALIAREAAKRDVSSDVARYDVSIARALNNLGMVSQAQGNLREAVEYYLRSMVLKEKVGEPHDQITTLGNIGGLFVLQGNNAQALQYLERAFALAERFKDARLMVDTLANIGRVFLDEARYADAEARLMRARLIAEQAGAQDQLAATLNTIADLEIRRGQWTRAVDSLARSRALFTEIGDQAGLAHVLLSSAQMAVGRGRFEAGAVLAQQAGDAFAGLGTPAPQIDAALLRGNALVRLRSWSDAIATFERAIALTERGLGLVAGDAEDRLRYLESGSSAYFGLAHAHASAGHAPEALAAAERGRARTLLDMLAAGRPGDSELDEAERSRQIELDTALVALNERVAAERARARTGARPDPSLVAEMERLRKSRDEFHLGLDAKHPQRRFARGEAPILSAAEVAATLPARSALVEFVVGPQGVWTLVLVPRAKGTPQLIVKAATLPADQVMRLAADLTRQVSTRDLAFAANARALYDALLGPVDTALAGVEHLIVVPHAGLWDVPFQALQTPRGRYLVEEHAIAYAPSASTLKALGSRRTKRAAQPRVVAFGDPRAADATSAALPHAAREAREVASVYGAGNAVVALEGDATEARFRQVASTADIVHIATHGVLDNASPLFSYLMLAGSDGQKSSDGRLEGHELINMRLAAELVVLSACETARGRIANGEGVVGLTWALFAAGASTAAVSLWPVDSASTTELMSAFHRERRKLTTAAAPAPTAQALRASQIAALSRSESRHPFYWAGFVVIGVP